MIRFICVATATILATLIFGGLGILSSFFDKSGHTIHRLSYIWARCIRLASFITVRCTGFEHIDPEKPYILMPNHQSYFDIPVLIENLPVTFRWLAKAELFRIPVFGSAMHRAGYISIDRSNRTSAIASLKKAAKAIREGASVLIFPEGTRTRDGELRDYKKGGFVLAVESGVPIIPMVIHGSFDVLPRHRLRMGNGPVCLQILPPIETSGFNMNTKENLMDKVHTAMQEALAQGRRAGLPC